MLSEPQALTQPQDWRGLQAEGMACGDDGVRIAWARYGAVGPHVLLMPAWSIVHSRMWKAQAPYLAHHYRVTLFDPRGNGRSGRPRGAAAYSHEHFAADALAVLDDAGVDHAVVVALSLGATWAVHLAAAHPERVDGLLAINPSCRFTGPPHPEPNPWEERLDTHDGWDMYNRHFWLAGPERYERFLGFFFGQMFNQAHSTKQIEDAVGWGRQIEAETLADTTAGSTGLDGAAWSPLEPLCRRVRCPVLVIHGTHDAICAPAVGERLAELTRGELLLVDGAGHGLPTRDPVLVNREIRSFVDRLVPPTADSRPLQERRRTFTRPHSRRPRALYLSSPIGLGHAWRDVAIAQAMRGLNPDLSIDWLAQDPVTRVLAEAGERVHPASARLAGESAHIEAECGEHDLNAFAAIRRMDEILIHNFMLFLDVVEEERYDLVVADEAWEVDHFVHENPDLKTFALAWLTDFVGWLPLPAGGAAEAALTADYNAEMVEHRARYRRARDRSVFVGNLDDVVTDPLGPGLPSVREWTAANFEFCGYVTAPPRQATPDELDHGPLLDRFGYGPDESVCLVTVGGSGVGLPLLRRIADAVPALRNAVPGLHVVMVTGPRIPAAAIGRRPGLDVHGYLPDLDRHLAACDVAVVQGGLTTCMELTAARRPFVYIPLRNHFEQNIHVRHRLGRYRAGHHVDYATACEPDALADVVLTALRTPPDYAPVEADGAARAAALISNLI